MDSVQRHLTLLSEEIDALEKPRHALIDSDPTLQKRSQLMQSLKGVGPVLSVTRLAMLPELGTLGHKQIAALVGGCALQQRQRSHERQAEHRRRKGSRPSRPLHGRTQRLTV